MNLLDVKDIIYRIQYSSTAFILKKKLRKKNQRKK